MNRFLTCFLVATAAMCAFSAPRGPGAHRGHPPPPPRHHGGHHHNHHHGKAFAVGAGILGAGLIASTIYNATHPAPVVVAQPTVVTPAPVVVQQPVVVTQPVATGHYETRVQNVWVEGRYVDQVVNGVVQRVWQPGHYEQQQTQVWVTP